MHRLNGVLHYTPASEILTTARIRARGIASSLKKLPDGSGQSRSVEHRTTEESVRDAPRVPSVLHPA